ncbi:MAG TPA: hypothetical protein VKA38_15175 [Draconibacterium sp.]|nr:hypothetical protein [Draconibacterium sp.]
MNDEPQQKDNSRVVLAFVLIGIGVLWILRRIGIYFDFPDIHLGNIFFPLRQFFHSFGHVIFSWPMILIVIGLVLMAGKRKSGVVFIIVGGVFLMPRIFLFHGLTVSLLLPLLLIGIGIAMVARLI